MIRNNAHQIYEQSKINSATPGELTLMLYNGALKFVRQAHQFIEEKNVEKANENILKTQKIITELTVTLNMDYSVSSNLAIMYEYINRRLVEANIKKDAIALEEIEGYLIELRDTWAKVLKMARG